MRRKNYKESCSSIPMYLAKRGQVTIFVIIAIVIVGLILVVFLVPKFRLTVLGGGDIAPANYIRSCLQADLEKSVIELSKKGGYSNPRGTLMYGGEEIPYLCYTSENYKTCVVQQPMIKSNFERELSALIIPKADKCFKDMVNSYESKGYSVSGGRAEGKLSIIYKKIEINFDSPLNIQKGDVKQNFNNFKVGIDSEMYDLLMIAQSIIEFESTYGDSETTTFMQYYPDLKIEKVKLSDGSKVYTLTNVVTEESFRFASRSISWPPGYGLV